MACTRHSPVCATRCIIVQDSDYLQMAFEEAERAYAVSEVPVGAVVVHNNTVIAQAHNMPISLCSPVAHAEIVAMQRAGAALGNYRLLDCTLYVTLEPCLMCYGAMVHARIKRCVFATPDPKSGVYTTGMLADCRSKLNHQLNMEHAVGDLSDQCKALLQRFFKERR